MAGRTLHLQFRRIERESHPAQQCTHESLWFYCIENAFLTLGAALMSANAAHSHSMLLEKSIVQNLRSNAEVKLAWHKIAFKPGNEVQRSKTKKVLCNAY
jgi:hypothetical protein